MDDWADTSPSRSRLALEGAHTGSSSWDFDRSPRPGASRSSARVELGQSGAYLRPPRPSGVAVVDSSSTFAGFRLAWGGLGGVFSRLWPLLVGPPRLGVLVRILPPASGRSFIGAPQRGSCRWVDCCLACPRAGVWRSSVRWRVATRVLMVAGFPLLRAWRSAPSHIPWPFLD